MNAPFKPSELPPQAWSDALARARADLAAGRTHDLSDVLADIETDIAAMTAQPGQLDDAPAQRHGSNL